MEAKRKPQIYGRGAQQVARQAVTLVVQAHSIQLILNWAFTSAHVMAMLPELEVEKPNLRFLLL
jgi:hypothetical protein